MSQHSPAARIQKALESQENIDEKSRDENKDLFITSCYNVRDDLDALLGQYAGHGFQAGWEAQHAQAQPLREALKVAVEVIEYYADTTNFEAVDEGRNFNEKWVVEEYNKHTVSGQPIGKIAYKALSRVADILEGHPIFQDSHTTLEGK